MNIFTYRLGVALDFNNMTPASLSRIMGVNRSTVTRWLKMGNGRFYGMANALGVDTSFFSKPIHATENIYIGNYKAANKKSYKQAHAGMIIAKDFIDVSSDCLTLENTALPIFDPISEYSDILDKASALMKYFINSVTPASSLMELLESNGIVCIDGGLPHDVSYSCWIDGTPFIYYSTKKENKAGQRLGIATQLYYLLLRIDSKTLSTDKYKELELKALVFAHGFLLECQSVETEIDNIFYLCHRLDISYLHYIKYLNIIGKISNADKTKLGKQYCQLKGLALTSTAYRETPSLFCRLASYLTSNGYMSNCDIRNTVAVNSNDLVCLLSLPNDVFEVVEQHGR